MTKIQTKTITITPEQKIPEKVIAAKVLNLTFLNDEHPIHDNPGTRSDKSDRGLVVNVNGSGYLVRLMADKYDAFYAKYGEAYSNADINAMLVEQLGLTVAT